MIITMDASLNYTSQTQSDQYVRRLKLEITKATFSDRWWG
jgi:hypothetical protein